MMPASAVDDEPVLRRRHLRPTLIGTAVVGAIALMVLAMITPALFEFAPNAGYFPPLAARWDPRFGLGTLPAILVGWIAVTSGFRWASALPWGWLLATSFVGGIAWMVGLAAVDGSSGLGRVLGYRNEYLYTARQITSISTALHEYIDRIPFSARPSNWPIQIAGHPPGALLFFVLLVRVGLGSPLAAGAVVITLAATVPVAVLVTLRRLGDEKSARNVAPLLVIGPSAIWLAVSGDAVFTTVAAWGLCALAFAAKDERTRAMVGWSCLAGTLLGYCAMLSYGLTLLVVPALAILLVTRTFRALPWAATAYLAVVLGFAAAGFAWWRAYPVLRARYWAGAAHIRPAGYWVWADLAALCFCAGPVVAASVTAAARQIRNRPLQPIVALTLAATGCVLIADLSLMSKAEVERIWLPFVPWMLLGCSLLPPRWRHRALIGQVGLALTVQTLLYTRW